MSKKCLISPTGLSSATLRTPSKQQKRCSRILLPRVRHPPRSHHLPATAILALVPPSSLRRLLVCLMFTPWFTRRGPRRPPTRRDRACRPQWIQNLLPLECPLQAWRLECYLKRSIRHRATLDLKRKHCNVAAVASAVNVTQCWSRERQCYNHFIYTLTHHNIQFNPSSCSTKTQMSR